MHWNGTREYPNLMFYYNLLQKQKQFDNSKIDVFLTNAKSTSII